jgi:hypothetical protein
MGEQVATGEELAGDTKDMHGSCKLNEDSLDTRGYAGRDGVSFGTDMSTEEEISDGRSVEQDTQPFMTTVERFHARKFRDNGGQSVDKRAILKVIGGGSNKKQKTPIKDCVKGMLKNLLETEDVDEVKPMAGDVPMKQHEMDVASGANPPIAHPIHMTGTHVKSHQEQ